MALIVTAFDVALLFITLWGSVDSHGGSCGQAAETVIRDFLRDVFEDSQLACGNERRRVGDLGGLQVGRQQIQICAWVLRET